MSSEYLTRPRFFLRWCIEILLLLLPLIEFPDRFGIRNKQRRILSLSLSLSSPSLLRVQGDTVDSPSPIRNSLSTQPRPNFAEHLAEWQYHRDWALSYFPLYACMLAVRLWDSHMQSRVRSNFFGSWDHFWIRHQHIVHYG